MKRSKLTDRQIEVRKKYTRVTKIFGKWNAYLQIDHQGFSIGENKTKNHAEWVCDMLAIALDRIIETETKLDNQTIKV